MRYSLLIILSLFAWKDLLSQKNHHGGKSPPYVDTTFTSVVLKDTLPDGKVVSVNIGKKAIIYIKLKLLLAEANEDQTDEFVRDSYKAIIHYFDSASLKGDTIFIDDYSSLTLFRYLISSQLIRGNARVFYKRESAFVDTILHRLERYGSRADRFFYLPDKRPFFVVNELSGIMDDDDRPRAGYYQAYLEEGKKLASIRQE